MALFGKKTSPAHPLPDPTLAGCPRRCWSWGLCAFQGAGPGSSDGFMFS